MGAPVRADKGSAQRVQIPFASGVTLSDVSVEVQGQQVRVCVGAEAALWHWQEDWGIGSAGAPAVAWKKAAHTLLLKWD